MDVACFGENHVVVTLRYIFTHILIILLIARRGYLTICLVNARKARI